MSETFPEKKKVASIEDAFAIQKKEHSKGERAVMQELEKRVPLLFEAENELIVARRYAREERLKHGIADNAPHAEEESFDTGMGEHIEKLIDEIAYIKAEMQELLEKMHVLDEEKKRLFEREAQFKDKRTTDE